MRRKLIVSIGVLAAAASLAACSGQGGTGAGTTATSSAAAAAETTSSTAPGGGEHSGHNSAGEQSPTAAPAPSAPAPGAMTIDVTVSGGKVSTAKQLVDVPVGSPVELVVTSDVADHVHVHGYDEMVDVVPGVPARVGFIASIPGVFEVELENAKLRLLQLRVQ
ncbi:hypothetical protein NWT09_27890 [Mycolicibacterium sp. jd]|nr:MULTISPECIES: hypothetical protein [Mycobacteriaceae]MDN4517315.1 hypothetical protein [Mycolicibacterium austroafricanum]UJL30648.1 hypothetical protein HZU38_09635 [Mycolicibacterium vanbaalenii]WND56246.1 hypothetical protein QQA43_26720 [Mycolicibacterium vanbaalenii]